MNLPDLAWQTTYGRIAWAVVLLALVMWLVSRRHTPSRRTLVLSGGALLTWSTLGGEASPAYWLALAFQWPSGLLTALCGVALVVRWRGQARGHGHGLGRFEPMPVWFATAIAVAGLCLYTDASGWVAFGLYGAGFGPRGAPLLAVLLAAACVGALMKRLVQPHAAAVLVALVLFMTLRLPTGNLWDALLDPFLWIWATAAVIVHAVRRLHLRSRVRPAARPSALFPPDLSPKDKGFP